MEINYISGGEFQSFYVNRQRLKDTVKNPPPKNKIPKNKENTLTTENKKKLKEEKMKKAVLAASLAGAVIPVIAINAARGKTKTLIDTFQNKASTPLQKASSLLGTIEIKDYGQILSSTTGGVLGAVTAGIISDKNPNDRDEKYKEGIFAFLNNMTPTTFVAIGEHFIGKKEEAIKAAKGAITQKEQAKYNGIRAALILTSVMGGMFIANKTSNKINEKYFKSDKKEEKRNFKIEDCFVHLDDLIGLFVLSKNPVLNTIASKVQMDKFLPFLYARSGYEAGIKKEEILQQKGNFSKNV